MPRMFAGYKREDWIIAAVSALLVFVLFGVQLTPGMVNWGDDFAAYLSEGIAISEGAFDEQVRLNGEMYMAEISEETREKGLVYVWGFPLLLAVVHSIAGFDMVSYSNVILYKIPSLLSFALLIGILYLFYRRFFPISLSLFLSALLAINQNFLYSIDILNVDIVFLLASMLSFLLAECFFDATAESLEKPTTLMLSVFLGISFWFTYETRLNGNTVIIVIALAHGIRLLQSKKQYSLAIVFRHLVPYILFFVLKVVSEWIFAPATSNTSHIGSLSQELIVENMKYYSAMTKDFLMELVNYSRLYDVFSVCLVIGLLTEGWRGRNFSFTTLMIGTYIVLILLPYVQGLRYLYGVLPFLLLYVGLGCRSIVRLCYRVIPKTECLHRFFAVSSAVLLFCVLVPISKPAVRNAVAAMQNGAYVCEDDVYTEEAIDMYRYIQNNTEEDDVIFFLKTRALHLNTGRLSIYPYINGHTMEDGDYYLFSSDVNCDMDFWMKEELEAIAPPVYENGVFYLYKIKE